VLDHIFVEDADAISSGVHSHELYIFDHISCA
jgi:hypothetical protein